MRDISDMGLQILLDMLNNFRKTQPGISSAFYQQYFCSILQDILYVLTNSFYSSGWSCLILGFKLQSVILMQMFAMVDEKAIEAPLSPNTQVSNADYLREFVMGLLASAFPHLTASQIQTFVLGLFSLSKDYVMFKGHLRDFLISLKV